MTERLTLGEAARSLRISRRTLDKWLERLSIEPEKHPQDWRFYTLTPEQVEAIREERAKMPGPVTGVTVSSSRTLAFDRRQSGKEPMRDVAPAVAPMPRQRPLQRESFSAAVAHGGETMLPEGMMSKADAGRLHHVPTSNIHRWCADGRIETAPGEYGGEHGRYPVRNPITRRGMQQFYQLASTRADFQRCADCPHEEESGKEEAPGYGM